MAKKTRIVEIFISGGSATTVVSRSDGKSRVYRNHSKHRPDTLFAMADKHLLYEEHVSDRYGQAIRLTPTSNMVQT